ncbi:hypothetical protein KVR01_005821 [Diaporthe batatas]|uniref:uncharacterized protein n=1 Tax=Diaporthe batatas TaxID=748121 RepID=UPI001D045DE9|nr:uncharacterized protein KVR01_005821 [Diaporthe batatas]KAG8163903.1 hypothetical protein KVR01_005821 [Diaporthe batatas]
MLLSITGTAAITGGAERTVQAGAGNTIEDSGSRKLDYNVMPYMRPLGFRLLKILGKGGFGMACLFEMTDVDGQKHQIVVKAGTRNDLMRERTYLTRLAGARHILQQQVIRGLPPPATIEPTPPHVLNLFGGNPPAFIEETFNMNPTMVGLEFMKYGDVHSLLQKAGSHQKTWKSEELWYIFHCLDGHPANHDGTVVHFDIEPQNGHLHNTTPIFKIGDMGIAQTFTQRQRRQLWPLLRCRRVGKPFIFTPIMWQLILGVYPDEPPQVVKLDLPNFPFWTYGGMLLFDQSESTQRIDFDLRFVVAACMSHLPQARPTMVDLEQVILRALGYDWAARETMPDEKFSMRELLGHPKTRSQYRLRAAHLHRGDPTHHLHLSLHLRLLRLLRLHLRQAQSWRVY